MSGKLKRFTDYCMCIACTVYCVHGVLHARCITKI